MLCYTVNLHKTHTAHIWVQETNKKVHDIYVVNFNRKNE